MDAKKLGKRIYQPVNEWDTSLGRLWKDFEALRIWLDRDVTTLENKHQDFKTHIKQGHYLKELFAKGDLALQNLNLQQEQARDFIHLLALLLWFFHLSICATLANLSTQNDAHSKIFIEISSHLFGNFVLLRDNLILLLNVRFESFNKKYANLMIYSVVKNFFSFYKTYCSWFPDDLPSIKEECEKARSGWEKVGYFLKRLRNKAEHEYDRYSSSFIDLKDFDSALELDFRDNSEYQPKIGNTVHKYPLAILVLIRFLLKDQGNSFDEINQHWFSCNQKIFDQSGNIKSFNLVNDPKK